MLLMRRCLCFLISVAFCVHSTSPVLADMPAPMPVPLAITLTVPNAPGKPYFDLDNPSSFYRVTIKNVSSKPQIIWKETCSEGYDNAGLIVLAINGTTLSPPVRVEQKPRFWTANRPEPQTLQPGEETVRRVYVSDMEPLYFIARFSYMGKRKRARRNLPLLPGPVLPRFGGKNSSRFETVQAIAVFDTLRFNTAEENARYGVWSGRVVSAPVTFRTGL